MTGTAERKNHHEQSGGERMPRYRTEIPTRMTAKKKEPERTNMTSRMIFLPLAAALALSGCVSSKDLAKTLRYADERAISVADFKFAELGKLSKGEACTVNFLNWLPLWGDGSLITAVERGKINRIHYIGETGYWYFPFNTNCTVVFGSDDPAPVSMTPEEAQTRAALAQPAAARPATTQPAEAKASAPRKHEFW